MTGSKPKYINNGYGKEKLCLHCGEYYLLNDDNFYRTSKSKQAHYVVIYESCCKPCYNYRKAQYRAKAKLKLGAINGCVRVNPRELGTHVQ